MKTKNNVKRNYVSVSYMISSFKCIDRNKSRKVKFTEKQIYNNKSKTNSLKFGLIYATTTSQIWVIINVERNSILEVGIRVYK